LKTSPRISSTAADGSSTLRSTPFEPGAPGDRLAMTLHRDQPSVQSPCVRNCCLDENDICLGCGRQLDEILRWRDASDDEREIILAAARQRRERR
jgi:uncharacterized protein